MPRTPPLRLVTEDDIGRRVVPGPETNSPKRRLLDKALRSQQQRYEAAVVAGDADECSALDRRMQHVRGLLAELDGRG